MSNPDGDDVPTLTVEESNKRQRNAQHDAASHPMHHFRIEAPHRVDPILPEERRPLPSPLNLQAQASRADAAGDTDLTEKARFDK